MSDAPGGYSASSVLDEKLLLLSLSSSVSGPVEPVAMDFKEVSKNSIEEEDSSTSSKIVRAFTKDSLTMDFLASRFLVSVGSRRGDAAGDRFMAEKEA